VTLSPRHLDFDAVTHTYHVDGVRVPGVTEMLWAEFPDQWRAAEFFLGRGQAVHAAAALIARDNLGGYDPQIEGQVQAIKDWFCDVQPEIIEVEAHGAHPVLRYGYTPDLVCRIDGYVDLVDYKASVNAVCRWQLAFYSMALRERGVNVDRAYPIGIGADGKYSVGLIGKEKVLKGTELKQAEREAANIRSVYGLRERYKLLPKTEEA
jgi:hypothetical protein